MPGLLEWHLTYCHGAEVTDLGLVSADWLTAFSQRHFDKGAEFIPGMGEVGHLLVIDRTPQGMPRRFYIIETPNQQEKRNARHQQPSAEGPAGPEALPSR